MANKSTTYINAGDASGDLTGAAITFDDFLGIFFAATWTGTPTGTLAVQASVDGTTWFTIGTTGDGVGFTANPAGSASSAWANVYDVYASYVRVIYTAGSGSGTLTVKYQRKRRNQGH